jgi:hypothetical protein
MAITSSFKTKCPSCEGLVVIKDPKLVGKTVACPKCKERFVVEDPVEADRKAVAEQETNGGTSAAKEGSSKTSEAVTAGKPAAKKDAVAAGPPRAPAKPAAKAPPAEDELEDLEELDELEPAAPKGKGNGKPANGKVANGKPAAKAAPADEDEDEDEEARPKAKAPAKRPRDEDDEHEEAKSKGKADGKRSTEEKEEAKAKDKKGKADKGEKGEDTDEGDKDEKAGSKKKKKKKAAAGLTSRKKLLIGLVLAGVGVAGLTVALILMNKKGPASPNTSGPMAKGGNQGAAQGDDPQKGGVGEKNQGDKTAGGPDQNQGDKTQGGNPGDNNPGGPRPGGNPSPSTPAGMELTNLLPKSTQGVFQLNLKEFMDSPMGTALDRSGAFADDDLRRRLGFSVGSLDRILIAENYADRWALTVLHSVDPIDDLAPLKKALGLKAPKGGAIKGQDYYEITRNDHWLANLGRLSLGAPTHVRNAQPPGEKAALYLRLHNRQTLIVANLPPMREFLTAGGRFDSWSGKPIGSPNPGGQPQPGPGGQPGFPGPGARPGVQGPEGQPGFPGAGGRPGFPGPGGQPGFPGPDGQPQKGPGGRPDFPGRPQQPGVRGDGAQVGGEREQFQAPAAQQGQFPGPGGQTPPGPGGQPPSGPGGKFPPQGPGGQPPQGPGGQPFPGPGGQPGMGPGGKFPPQGPEGQPGFPGAGGRPGFPGPGGQPGFPGPGGQPGGQQQPARLVETYETINPALKAMLDRMGRRSDRSERVIFISATDMRAARLVSRDPEEKDRILWRIRPVWDLTNLLHEKTERIGVLGTALLMKDQMNYLYRNAMSCPSDAEAKTLQADLKKVAAPSVIRLFRLLLNHKVELVKDEPNAPTGNQGGPFPGGFPGGVPPGFPGGMPGGIPKMPGPGGFPRPGGGGPGFPGPGGFPFPGAGNPGGEETFEKKEEVKSSRILVTHNDKDVQFRLDLVLDPAAYEAMKKALQVVMVGLRTEIDAAEGAVRRHDLAAAGRRLGEQGLSNRRILPGRYPPGALPRAPTNQRSAREPGRRISWMAGLLPYLGHENLFGQIDFDRSWNDPGNWLAARTVVPEFLDPSFPRRARYVPYPDLPLEAAATNYVGLAGIGPDAAEYSAGDPAVVDKLGVFGYERGASLDEIRKGRGQSNVIVMIRVPYDGPAGVTPWMAGGGSTVRSVPEKDSVEPFLSTEKDGSRGTYALMADGSVRYIKKGISDAAFKAMVTVRGPAPANIDLDKEAPLVPGPQQQSPAKGKDGGKKETPKEGGKKEAPPPKGSEQPKEKEPTPEQATQLFSPPGAGCSVMMPKGEVKQLDQKVPLPKGGTMTVQLHMLSQGTNNFMLSLADVPAGSGSGEKLLDGTRDQLAKMVPGAKVADEKKVTVDGHPARDMTIEIPGIGLARARVVVAGQRVYQASVVGASGFVNSTQADRYLQSLKILKLP